MKVLLLFANSAVRKGRAFPEELKDLLQAAAGVKKEDIEFFVGYARSLSFLISNGQVKIRDHHNRMNLEDYDFVYFRKAGAAMQQMMTCAYYLKDRGVPFWDGELLKASSRNKLSQMIMMERHGLPVPATLFCRNRKRLARLVSDTYKDVFQFPLILKATGGSRGDANYLVDNKEELLEKIKDEKNRSFIVQEFIPNDGDYRFFVVDGVVKGIIGRQSQEGSHLNNTSKGGKAQVLPNSMFKPEVIAGAQQAATIFARDVAGVDVMIDKRDGRYYLLEVNRAPQIERSSFEHEKAEWIVDSISSALAQYQPSPLHFGSDGSGTIGRFEYVRLGGGEKIVAKVDTGADSSSVHCDYTREDDGKLVFSINGIERTVDNFSYKQVKSSNGDLQKRYYIMFPMSIGDNEYMMKLTLSNRGSMKNKMLIGRRFLREHHLLVDVSRRFILSGKKLDAKE
jgi:RimK family alpha-L-glutamate ligase